MLWLDLTLNFADIFMFQDTCSKNSLNWQDQVCSSKKIKSKFFFALASSDFKMQNLNKKRDVLGIKSHLRINLKQFTIYISWKIAWKLIFPRAKDKFNPQNQNKHCACF